MEKGMTQKGLSATLEKSTAQNMLSAIDVKKDTTWIEMNDICDG